MIKLALKNLWRRPLRSGLTMVGVTFGVCAVVAMLSIGEGVRQDVVANIVAMGTRNVVMKSVRPERTGLKIVLTYGLRDRDVAYLRQWDDVAEAVPVMRFPLSIRWQGHSVEGAANATVPAWAAVMEGKLVAGRFLNVEDERTSRRVCVLTEEAVKTLGVSGGALGEDVCIGGMWCRVVGVMKGAENQAFFPLATARERWGMVRPAKKDQEGKERVEINELVVQMSDLSRVEVIADRLARYVEVIGKRKEVEIIVPLKLLQQEQRAQRTFQMAMGSIAAIALLVGGIGIMNIMLATVTERTKEIGMRRALGATQRDILHQFLVEGMVLTMMGAVAGLLLGGGVARGVAQMVNWPLVYSFKSFLIPFVAAVGLGVVSGVYPALRAAELDPIKALRSE